MIRTWLAVSIVTGFLSLAQAAMPSPPEKALKSPSLQPATRYSGRTPIDLTNGMPFNNGTFGARNPTWERWASTPSLVPGVSELPYPYEERDDLVQGLEESAVFIDAAIFNWKETSEITKPEAKAYSEESSAKLQAMLDSFRVVIKKTANANRTDWDKTQADARRALVELRATYSSIHRNVR